MSGARALALNPDVLDRAPRLRGRPTREKPGSSWRRQKAVVALAVVFLMAASLALTLVSAQAQAAQGGHMMVAHE